MKPLKKTFQFFISALLLMCLFVRCTPTEPAIPYNAENAKEHIITIKAAKALTAGFRAEKAAMAKQLKDSAYLNTNFSLPLAEKFNRDAIAVLLNQKGAKGIRIYLGKDTKGLIRFVLVAVDDKGNDLAMGKKKVLKGSASMMIAADDDSGDGDCIALEAGQRCPTLCSTDGIGQ